jgi:hypothetical protein
VDCGELWSKQVKVFEVSPGHHRLGLRQGFVIRSKVMDFSVQPGEVAEFACAQIATALGRTGLHPATPEESLAMRELVPPSPTPGICLLPSSAAALFRNGSPTRRSGAGTAQGTQSKAEQQDSGGRKSAPRGNQNDPIPLSAS